MLLIIGYSILKIIAFILFLMAVRVGILFYFGLPLDWEE